MELMRQALFSSDLLWLSALAVWPMKPGMAVATSTVELGKAFFS